MLQVYTSGTPSGYIRHMTDRHKIKSRSYRLPQALDDRWQAFLDDQGISGTQATQKAIEAYLNNYYDFTKGTKKDV